MEEVKAQSYEFNEKYEENILEKINEEKIGVLVQINHDYCIDTLIIN
jgi:hypothetical protein